MNILVVDDHPLTCAGLKLLLESSLPGLVATGVHSAAKAREWLEAGHRPDWIFLDVRLPDDPHGSLFDWLRTQSLASRVVLISADAPDDTIRRGVAAGARGFIPKSAEPARVLEGFAAIRAGHVHVPARLAPAPAEAAPLSPRKEDVLRLLRQGLSNKRIARELGLSEHTVKEYVSAILASRGAASRMDLILQLAPLSGDGRPG